MYNLVAISCKPVLQVARIFAQLSLWGTPQCGLCSWNRGQGDLCAAFRPAGTSSSQSRCKWSCSCEFRPGTHRQARHIIRCRSDSGEVNHPKMEDANSVSPIPGTDTWSFWKAGNTKTSLYSFCWVLVLYPHGEMSRLLCIPPGMGTYCCPV